MAGYQTIIINGKTVQTGDIDTPTKFSQLTQGVNLSNKSLIDVGCNTGFMCYLSELKGAKPQGIDPHLPTLAKAKKLFPSINFRPGYAETLSTSCDIIIASAVLHYTDLDQTLKQFSRCAEQVLCDVWHSSSPDTTYTLSHRDIFIPSLSTFNHIASKYFTTIINRGPCLSPDGSTRTIFHLSNPTPPKPSALLISGLSNAGKTTFSNYIPYRIVLHLDDITHHWGFYNQGDLHSVSNFYKLIHGKLLDKFYKHYQEQLLEWLSMNSLRDIVIEGYDLLHDDLKKLILSNLTNFTIEELKL